MRLTLSQRTGLTEVLCILHSHAVGSLTRRGLHQPDIPPDGYILTPTTAQTTKHS